MLRLKLKARRILDREDSSRAGRRAPLLRPFNIQSRSGSYREEAAHVRFKSTLSVAYAADRAPSTAEDDAAGADTLNPVNIQPSTRTAYTENSTMTFIYIAALRWVATDVVTDVVINADTSALRQSLS
ncbi:hypothetical protein EVAR_86023_1 [Eumeta japonica]|uniref:Uncharacterized protein n=1 Tax=Eumeta variegata TaxID=151549 RepID=A0A4C1UJ69_EUMVA|nr:hypothetical protein EVAR_86023_1 [Eumeta japonica]